MDINSSVEGLTQELQEAVGDIADFLEKLQQKLDEVEEAKDNLETYQGQINQVLHALENLQAEDLDSGLEDAGRLVE